MAELLTDQLRLMAEHFGAEVGYIDCGSGEHLTFAEWESRSNRVGRWLMGAGVAKGDRVALFLPPEEPLDWMVGYAGIHKAGAVAVPTSARLVSRELEFVLAHAGAVAALVGSALVPVLSEARPQLPELRVVLTAPWPEAMAESDETFQIAVDGDDMADLMYTSGTTGRPKGVVVRHRNVAMIPNGLPRWSGAGWLHASPMFTFAGIASVYNPMKLGMRGLYLPRFDVGSWIEVVEREAPSATFLVPAMAQLLLGDARFERADLSSLKMCSLGSAPVAPETIRRLRARLPGCAVSNGWGMTEAGPAFCSMPPGEADRRVGSVGKPLPPTEFRIVDDDGRTLPPGDAGELLVRNPGREREYFRDPEVTAETWRDGWLHSGDLAYLDADGFLYIVGRKKDVIIRGGNNIHASDIESVLYEHPDVQEAAVTGIPHEVLGEDVGAWIVLRPGTDVSADAVRSFCAARLADYKVPRRVFFVDELPRNATGKVVKRDLVVPA